MKKLLLTALTLILATSMLVACAPSTPDQQTSNKAITEYTTEGKVTKLVPDETATGELTVNLMSFFQGYSPYIERLYNKLYPNVKLNLVVWDELISNENFDGYSESIKFQTQVMAGSGPDVFVTGGVLDVEKVMQSDVYADMTSYFENDKYFNIDDFNKSVFYSGQNDGKQYVIPVQYNFPLFMTSQSVVDEVGLDLTKCKDFFSTGEELGSVLKENKFGCESKTIFKWLTTPYYFLIYSGLSWIDYNDKTANLDTIEIEKAYSMLKESFFPYLKSQTGSIGITNTLLETSPFINKKTMFAEFSTDNKHRIHINSKALTGSGDMPVIFPWRNVNGGITAFAGANLVVNNDCENKENAYNFIKMMISEEFYASMYEDESNSMRQYLGSNPSINNKATRYIFSQDKGEKGVKEWYFDGQENYQLEYVADEIIEQYMGFINEVDSVSFDPKVAYDVCAIMQPYLEDKATYEECIEKAQGMLEIYITE